MTQPCLWLPENLVREQRQLTELGVVCGDGDDCRMRVIKECCFVYNTNNFKKFELTFFVCSTIKVSTILKKNCLEKLLNAPMFIYNRKKYKKLQNVRQTRDLFWSHGFVTSSRLLSQSPLFI
jgi:hypothetical protein